MPQLDIRRWRPAALSGAFRLLKYSDRRTDDSGEPALSEERVTSVARLLFGS